MEFSSGNDLRIPVLLSLLREVIEADAARSPEPRDQVIAAWRERAKLLSRDTLRIEPDTVATLLDPTLPDQSRALRDELHRQLEQEVDRWFAQMLPTPDS